ncbi:hypothetical protein Tco_0530974 [Tanacetum coccineum]
MEIGTKSIKRAYRIQQHLKDSSEGSGVNLEVPDESRDDSGSLTSISSDSDDETEIISSDDEKKADDQEKVADEEMKDVEKAESEKTEEEHVDEEKAEEDKIEEEKADDEQAGFDQAQDDQAGFLNVSSETSLVGILKDHTKVEIQSMVDVPVHQENHVVQRTPLVDTVISMVTEKTTPTPTQTPPTIEAHVTPASESDPSLKFEQRLLELEKKVEVLSKVDHSEAIEESIQANVFNKVKNHLPKLLPKVVSNFVKPRMESTVCDVLQNNPINLFKSSSSSTFIDSFTEYELLNMLYDKMQNSRSFNEHEKHFDLYNDLIGLIHLDEAIAKGETDPTKDSEPSKDRDQSGSSKAGKTPSKPSSTDKTVNAEERVHEVTTKADETMEVKDKVFSMHRLKKDKITKADLEGPAYNLLKGTYRNNIELEYNLEQCYLALSDKLDWTNPKGDRCPFDLSKPLPLQDYQGRLITPVHFFFNNNLEYLKTRNKERKYASSLTKTKAARYDLGPKHQLFYRSRNASTSHHEVISRLKILSVIRISVDKQFGYGYLKEIIVRRAAQKEYTFREADFSRLHLNDIEDMFLLYVQHKLHNLTGDDIVDLMISLRMFTESIIIKRRVEDVQLGVESYQQKLNIIRPQTTFDGISFKEPYTTVYEPK